MAEIPASKIAVRFGTIPPADVRQQLRDAGFEFDREHTAWIAERSPETEVLAQAIELERKARFTQRLTDRERKQVGQTAMPNPTVRQAAGNRVEVRFAGIPPEEVRSRLRAAGFRYDAATRSWSAERSDATAATAQQIESERQAFRQQRAGRPSPAVEASAAPAAPAPPTAVPSTPAAPPAPVAEASPAPVPAAPAAPAAPADQAADRVEIHFKMIPPKEVRARMRAAGFDYDKLTHAWFAPRTEATLALARQIEEEREAVRARKAAERGAGVASPAPAAAPAPAASPASAPVATPVPATLADQLAGLHGVVVPGLGTWEDSEGSRRYSLSNQGTAARPQQRIAFVSEARNGPIKVSLGESQGRDASAWRFGNRQYRAASVAEAREMAEGWVRNRTFPASKPVPEYEWQLGPDAPADKQVPGEDATYQEVVAGALTDEVRASLLERLPQALGQEQSLTLFRNDLARVIAAEAARQMGSLLAAAEASAARGDAGAAAAGRLKAHALDGLLGDENRQQALAGQVVADMAREVAQNAQAAEAAQRAWANWDRTSAVQQELRERMAAELAPLAAQSGMAKGKLPTNADTWFITVPAARQNRGVSRSLDATFSVRPIIHGTRLAYRIGATYRYQVDGETSSTGGAFHAKTAEQAIGWVNTLAGQERGEVSLGERARQGADLGIANDTGSAYLAVYTYDTDDLATLPAELRSRLAGPAPAGEVAPAAPAAGEAPSSTPLPEVNREALRQEIVQQAVGTKRAAIEDILSTDTRIEDMPRMVANTAIANMITERIEWLRVEADTVEGQNPGGARLCRAAAEALTADLSNAEVLDALATQAIRGVVASRSEDDRRAKVATLLAGLDPAGLEKIASEICQRFQAEPGAWAGRWVREIASGDLGQVLGDIEAGKGGYAQARESIHALVRDGMLHSRVADRLMVALEDHLTKRPIDIQPGDRVAAVGADPTRRMIPLAGMVREVIRNSSGAPGLHITNEQGETSRVWFEDFHITVTQRYQAPAAGVAPATQAAAPSAPSAELVAEVRKALDAVRPGLPDRTVSRLAQIVHCIRAQQPLPEARLLEMVYPDNKACRKAFAELVGFALPNTIKGTASAIEAAINRASASVDPAGVHNDFQGTTIVGAYRIDYLPPTFVAPRKSIGPYYRCQWDDRDLGPGPQVMTGFPNRAAATAWAEERVAEAAREQAAAGSELTVTYAAFEDQAQQVWSGRLELPADRTEALERIYRRFNNVDGSAQEIARQQGLRSMSVGDVVVLDGRAAIVAPFGFRDTTDDELRAYLALPTAMERGTWIRKSTDEPAEQAAATAPPASADQAPTADPAAAAEAAAAAAAGRVPVAMIRMQNENDGVQHEVRSFAAAKALLEQWVPAAPAEGGYHKMFFTVRWADGTEHEGRMDLMHPSRLNAEPADLAAHVGNFMLRRGGLQQPPGMNAGKYEELLRIMEQRQPGEGQALRELLRTHEIPGYNLAKTIDQAAAEAAAQIAVPPERVSGDQVPPPVTAQIQSVTESILRQFPGTLGATAQSVAGNAIAEAYARRWAPGTRVEINLASGEPQWQAGDVVGVGQSGGAPALMVALSDRTAAINPLSLSRIRVAAPAPGASEQAQVAAPAADRPTGAVMEASIEVATRMREAAAAPPAAGAVFGPAFRSVRPTADGRRWLTDGVLVLEDSASLADTGPEYAGHIAKRREGLAADSRPAVALQAELFQPSAEDPDTRLLPVGVLRQDDRVALGDVHRRLAADPRMDQMFCVQDSGPIAVRFTAHAFRYAQQATGATEVRLGRLRGTPTALFMRDGQVRAVLISARQGEPGEGVTEITADLLRAVRATLAQPAMQAQSPSAPAASAPAAAEPSAASQEPQLPHLSFVTGSRAEADPLPAQAVIFDIMRGGRIAVSYRAAHDGTTADVARIVSLRRDDVRSAFNAINDRADDRGVTMGVTVTGADPRGAGWVVSRDMMMVARDGSQEAQAIIVGRMPANSIVYRVSDPDGRRLGLVLMPHDASIEGMRAAGLRAQQESEAIYGTPSRITSMMTATNAAGDEAWVISPNLSRIAVAGSARARYILGDLTAAAEAEREEAQAAAAADPAAVAEASAALSPTPPAAEMAPAAPAGGPEAEQAEPAPAAPAEDGALPAAQAADSAAEAGAEATPAGRRPRVVQAAQPAMNARNWVYPDAAQIGTGGVRTKVRDNLAAIEALKRVELERRSPDEAEKAAMARYVGWGALKAAFSPWDDPSKDVTDAERARLRELLPDREYAAASKSILNAHYTAPVVVQAMWDALRHMGFTGGRINEPSMGIGYFYGLMPEEIRKNSRLTGIELDRVTGRMAQHLYPDANIQVSGYEQLAIPDGFFDLTVGNFPFGEYGVSDRRYRSMNPLIHDYFFLKSLDVTRPGGLVAALTSTGTLDKQDSTIREALASKADLVAAFRLPSSTHKQNAGTEVVTDLLFLRRRPDGEAARGPAWSATVEIPDPAGKQPMRVNEYWRDHPDHILGKMARTGGMYRADSITVEPTGDLVELLREAVAALPTDLYKPRIEAHMEAHNERFAERTRGRSRGEGRMVVRDGKVFRQVQTGEEPVEVTKEQAQRIAGMLDVLQALNTLISAETRGSAEAEVGKLRKTLNTVYDRFVRRHGFITADVNADLLDGNPDLPRLLALENWDGEKKAATKRAIFTQSTIRSYRRRDRADTIGDALSIALSEGGNGQIDVPRVAELLQVEPAEAARQLGEAGLAFRDPASNAWMPADLYLSGNVREKLEVATAAAKADASFEPNVQALAKSIPRDIPAEEIEVRPGVSWIPPKDIEAFAKDLFDSYTNPVTVEYMPAGAEWLVEWSTTGKRLSASAEARQMYGTKEVPFDSILEHALKNTQPVVMSKDADGQVFVNVDATESARQKVADVVQRFKDWVWKDESRRNRLVRAYNDKFNSYKPIEWNGAHLELPGIAAVFRGQPLALRPHQKNAVWATVVQRSMLYGHEVGTGKTLSMGTAAMELRRRGLAKKPAIACLRANVDAVAGDIQEAFPNANILVIKSLPGDRRRQIVAQIATGDYDAVVMTHEVMNMLPMSMETEQRFLDKELEELRSHKIDMMAHADDGERRKSVKRAMRNLENAIAKREEKLKDLLDAKRDDAVTWEETGIDALFVDEAHQFKSLDLQTRHVQVRGIPNAQSQRATAMLMRTQWIMENGGRVVFATGTPVSNTVAELYNFQRYLQPDTLEKAGIGHFDAWLNAFGRIETNLEASAEGDYRPVARLARFVNLPELRTMASEILDIQLAENMPDIVRPKRVDQVVVAERTEAQRELIGQIRMRAMQIRARQVEPKEDNFLKLSSDGRNGAVDMRLVDPQGSDDPRTKVNMLVEQVLANAKANKGKTQLIFSDVGVHEREDEESKATFRLYGAIIDKIEAGGIPREKIIDFSRLTEKQKEGAIRRLNEGDALVGIGGTQKLGTGVNCQRHLMALHHLDAPWRPSDVEQRDGRGWRQGNTNKEIQINRYVTKGTFDEVMWQKLATKQRFINQFIRWVPGESTVREMQEGDTDRLSFDEIQAVAAENPLVIERVRAAQEVDQLDRAKRAHERQILDARRHLEHLSHMRDSDQERIVRIKKDADTVAANKGDGFAIEIIGAKIDKMEEAIPALVKAIKEKVEGDSQNWTRIGTYRGLGIVGKAGTIGNANLALRGAEDHEIHYDPKAPEGTVRSIVMQAVSLAGKVAGYEAQIANQTAQIEKLRPEVERPFTLAKQLEDARKHLTEIDKKLAETSQKKDGQQKPGQAESRPDPRGLILRDAAAAMDEAKQMAVRRNPDAQDPYANRDEIHLAMAKRDLEAVRDAHGGIWFQRTGKPDAQVSLDEVVVNPDARKVTARVLGGGPAAPGRSRGMSR